MLLWNERILEVQNEEHARMLLDHPTLRKNVEEEGVEQLELAALDS